MTLRLAIELRPDIARDVGIVVAFSTSCRAAWQQLYAALSAKHFDESSHRMEPKTKVALNAYLKTRSRGARMQLIKDLAGKVLPDIAGAIADAQAEEKQLADYRNKLAHQTASVSSDEKIPAAWIDFEKLPFTDLTEATTEIDSRQLVESYRSYADRLWHLANWTYDRLFDEVALSNADVDHHLPAFKNP